MRASGIARFIIKILVLILFIGLPIIGCGLLWWSMVRPSPWTPYELALPHGGGLIYRWRAIGGFGPGSEEEFELLWRTPQSNRHRFYGGWAFPQQDVEFRTRKDGQAIWAITYSDAHGDYEEGEVTFSLDLATGKFVARDGRSASPGASMRWQRRDAWTGEQMPDWATLQGGKPVARWLYVYKAPVSIMFHWSPRFTGTTLVKKQLPGRCWALVVESSNLIYCTAEVRQPYWHAIVDYSGGKPQVRATFDFDRNEFIDENMNVWQFGRAFGDPIVRLPKPAEAYPEWAKLSDDDFIVARKYARDNE